MNYNWKAWGKFGFSVGVIYGIIQAVILFLLAAVIGAVVSEPLAGGIVGILLALFVFVLAIIFSSIKWAIFGFFYDLFLVGFLRRFSIFWQLYSISLFIEAAMFLFAVLLGNAGDALLSLFIGAITSAISIWIFLFIVKVFRLRIPLKGGK